MALSVSTDCERLSSVEAAWSDCISIERESEQLSGGNVFGIKAPLSRPSSHPHHAPIVAVLEEISANSENSTFPVSKWRRALYLNIGELWGRRPRRIVLHPTVCKVVAFREIGKLCVRRWARMPEIGSRDHGGSLLACRKCDCQPPGPGTLTVAGLDEPAPPAPS
jgi:hypothetical protein